MISEKCPELIQGVINRVVANSFHLRSSSVVLVSASFTLAGRNTKPYFVVVGAILFMTLCIRHSRIRTPEAHGRGRPLQ